MSNFTDFKSSLDQLVAQAQQTARLGLEVARDQVETLVRNPNINDQVDEVRRNLQTMAHDIETKAQELVHLATSYVQQGGPMGGAARPTSRPTSGPTAEPPTGNESATAAGAGTPQTGSNMNQETPTHGGEAPHQG